MALNGMALNGMGSILRSSRCAKPKKDELGINFAANEALEFWPIPSHLAFVV
jgi:hypothetical protein